MRNTPVIERMARASPMQFSTSTFSMVHQGLPGSEKIHNWMRNKTAITSRYLARRNAERTRAPGFKPDVKSIPFGEKRVIRRHRPEDKP